MSTIPSSQPATSENSVKEFFRYFRMWLALARNSLLRQSEFKLNFIGRALIETIWLGTQFLLYIATFRFIDSLAGWSQSEIWFFVGTLFYVDALMMTFFHDNHDRFGRIIRLGLFDFYLLYPISTLFLANFRFVNVTSIINLVASMALIFWAGGHSEIQLSDLQWLLWFFYASLGGVIVGALGVIVSTLAFWTTQTGSLMWLFYECYRLGHRPESLYRPWLQRILLSLFPAAFFVSIPVQLSLGKVYGWWWHLYPIIVATAVISLAFLVWNRGVRRYEGAMS